MRHDNGDEGVSKGVIMVTDRGIQADEGRVVRTHQGGEKHKVCKIIELNILVGKEQKGVIFEG